MRARSLRLLGKERAIDLWSKTAEAQKAAGRRAGVARFTRYALEAAEDLSESLEARRSRLTSAIERLQAGYSYYTGPKRKRGGVALTKPLDEPYSRFLAQQLIEEAFADRTLTQAAADILPLARRLYHIPRRSLPRILFEAVGMENLGSADLCLYAGCSKDKDVKATALKLAMAAGGLDRPRSERLRMQVISACANAGESEYAETVLNEFLADPSTDHTNKANAAYIYAGALRRAGKLGDAAKWYELVIERFSDTHFVDVARSGLERCAKSRSEESNP